MARFAKTSSNLLLVSYASGMAGFSPSEWVEDKILSALDLGYSVTVVTSFGSKLASRDRLRVVKVRSISARDLKIEQSQLSETRNGEIRGVARNLASRTFGRLFDFFTLKALGQHSDGRYSWTFSAFPIVFRETLRLKPFAVLATGGPSSAHLAAVIAGLLSGKRPILEFQDPFIGSEMRLVGRAQKMIRMVEEFLVRFSKKTVFVTEAAALTCRNRNPFAASRVSCIYPGAYDYTSSIEGQLPFVANDSIRLVHLGTLYGSRNLDSFFAALDDLISQGSLPAHIFHVENIGSVYLPNRSNYEARSDTTLSESVDREQGLVRSMRADYMLLVQHTDSRSLETIPYKFYDYVNTGKPIFLLHNNLELRNLVESYGGLAADINDSQAIKKALLQLWRESAGQSSQARVVPSRKSPFSSTERLSYLLSS